MKKQTIAVFCGSRCGKGEVYRMLARQVGETLAADGRTLVFGGCDTGLMGAVSRAVYEKGGKVISVRIKGLEDAYAPEIMAEDELLQNVQQRKRRLIERADACLVLPGGFGTLDEIGDVLSMAQLGDLKRPLGLLNVNGFFDGLLQLADTMLQEGFMGEKDRALLIARENTDDLLQALDEA